MRLKRLVVRGFKSFADRTEFEFDSALTGIIGPNGCGKSNVVDAIKWVLGDQRAKSLRGKEMTDVIFKGAEGREGLSAAEVTIHLEDETGQGALGGANDLSIGRRLSADKESEYLINGDSNRLKDVRDILMDTGLGVGAYSVMEQGRIDAVLSANPEERRAIFEEAAGISKFKLQKRETLRKLERTDQNLSRIRDLLDERGKRIRSLKVQAGKARRYVELQQALRDLMTAVAVVDGRALRAEKHALLARLDELAGLVAEAEATQRDAQGAVAAVEERIQEHGHRLEELQSRVHAARSARDGARAQSEARRQRAAEMERDAVDADERGAHVRAQHATRTNVVAQLRTEIAELEDELVGLAEQLESRQQQVRDGQRQLKELQATRETERQQVLEWIHTRTRHRNLAHDQEVQIRQLDARRNRVDERHGQLAAQLDRTRDELATLGRVLEDLSQRGALLQSEEQTLLAALEAEDRRAAELAQQESGLQGRLASVRGRLDALEDMEQHMEGLDQGPRHLLTTKPEGLRGRLLDLFDVDLELSAALEAALGPFVQALVVDTRAHAEAMLADLQTERRGRAILLVAEEFGADLIRGLPTSVPDGARALAPLIRCEPHAQPLLHWLLRGVCLVDSLANADGSRHDLCFVTRDGQMRCGPRIEGGTTEAQERGGGLVVRRAQIHDLRASAELLEGELSELRGVRTTVADRAAVLKDRARELAAAASAIRKEEQEARGQIGRHEGRQHDLERERETAELERADVVRQRLRSVVSLGRHLLDVHLVTRIEAAVAAREAQAGAAVAAAQSELAGCVAAEQELRLRQVGRAGDRDGKTAAVRLNEQAIADLDRSSRDLAQRATEARNEAEKARDEAVRADERARGLDDELDTLSSQRDEAAALVANEQAERARQRATAAEADERRQRLQAEHTELRIRVGDVDHRFDHLEQRLREEAGVELRRCLDEIEGVGLCARDVEGPDLPSELCEGPDAAFPILHGPALPPAMVEVEASLQRTWLAVDFDADASRKEVQVLDAQLQRLGPVNLDAVRELEEEEAGFTFLEQEVQDLIDARRNLVETIRKLETESRVLFERTFEAARVNFREIFRKLFQGGRADMTLTDTEDMLEAGIEIVAKPPGKELQSINLLSGGERSLTALAILFAVFKVKPSPFCILDEVDAALDETNVERFLRVLQDFVGPTQFCVVTHHKRTMAACQVLYGITMQKRGVSSRIAVSLDQVDTVTSSAPGADMSLAGRQRIAGEEQVGF